MRLFSGRLFVYFGLIFCISFSPLCSNEEAKFDANTRLVEASHPQKQESLFPQGGLTNPQQVGLEKYGNAASCRTKVFIDGEVLYWKPSQTGMGFCVTADQPSQIILGQTNHNQVQHTNWGWGLRIGTGVRIPTVNYEVAAYWTRFHHTMKGEVFSEQLILGTLFFTGDTTPVGGAGTALLPGSMGIAGGGSSSRWRMSLDLLELEMCHLLCFKKQFLLKPYLACEAGWIYQKQIVLYERFFNPATMSGFFNYQATLTNRFIGIGPKVGMIGNFLFGYGLGLMGNLATGFLYGSLKSPVVFETDDLASFSFPEITFHAHQRQLIPNIQASLGLNWEKVCAKYCTLFLSVSYEVQYFWSTWRNQGSIIQNVAITNAGFGDLMVQGCTGQVQFAF
jgi:hypothetical protein